MSIHTEEPDGMGKRALPSLEEKVTDKLRNPVKFPQGDSGPYHR